MVIFCSCACVRVTFWPRGGSAPDLGEQPAITRSEAAIAPAARKRLVIFGLFQIVAMPPASTQRLEQRGSVGVTVGLRLDERDLGLLIGRLRAQKSQIIGVAVLQLPLDEIERGLGSVVGRRRRL